MNSLAMLVMPSFRDQVTKPRRRIPASLIPLAAEMVHAGTSEVEVLDTETLGWNTQNTVDYIIQRQPRFVGLSVCSPTFGTCSAISRALRNSLPEVLLAMGGKHITACWEEVRVQCPEVDALVVGEGEEFVRVVALSAGLSRDQVVARLAELPNVLTAAQPDKTPALPIPYNLQHAPRRPYQLITPNLGYYGGHVVPIEYSRGCRGRCAYCLAPRYRHGLSWRNPNEVIDDLSMFNELGFARFFFSDDDFTSSPHHVERLCHAILDAAIEIAFDANVRPDTLMQCTALAPLLREAGCRCLWLGVESGSTRILDAYNKHFGLEACMEALEVAMSAARVVKTNWLIGAPEESVETVEESIAFAEKLRAVGPHLPHISFLVPYPGTPIYDSAITNGLITRSDLDRVRWETHAGALMPSLYLSREEINRLYKEFHARLYNADFLASVTEEVAVECESMGPP